MLTSFDVTKNTALTDELDCELNQLTSLDVTECTALEYLECTCNQLTAEGLNALFGTLHTNDVHPDAIKTINVYSNPGDWYFDRSIAEVRGRFVP